MKSADYLCNSPDVHSFLLTSPKDCHSDWCQELTQDFPVQVFPKIVSENMEFHEVIAYVHPQYGYTLNKSQKYKMIDSIKQNKAISSFSFGSFFKNGFVSHFLVKHNNRKHRTITKMVNHYNIDSTVKIPIESQNGQEKWIFLSNDLQRLNSLMDSLKSDGLGSVKSLTHSKCRSYRIGMYSKFLESTGISASESSVLSIAKVFGFLLDYENVNIMQSVLNTSKMDLDTFMNTLDKAVVSSSRINDAMKQLRLNNLLS